MQENNPLDVQSMILEEVTKLSQRNTQADKSQEKLLENMATFQVQLSKIHYENSKQTENLTKLSKVLDDHVSELDHFKAETSKNLTSITNNVAKVTQDLGEHMYVETQEIKTMRNEVTNRIDALLSAFPEDKSSMKPMLKEHRDEHESAWGSKVRWERRKEKAYEHLFVGGVWSAVIFILLAVWEAFKVKVGS